MSAWDKLIRKISSLSKDMRFSELKKVLEANGYEMKNPSGGSSHFTFRKAGKPPITIPKDEPIKVTYVKLVKEAIESEEEL